MRERNNLYLGIDVSKGYADFCLLDSTRNVLGKVLQFYDVKENHKKLEDYLFDIYRCYQPEFIYVAAESTASYEDRWIETLHHLSERLPIRVARLNPLGVLRFRQSNLKQQFTDKTSAQAIAEYLLVNSDEINYYHPCAYKDYRPVIKHVELLEKQKGQLANKLDLYLYRYFPELLPYCKNSKPKWVLRLVAKYPTSKRMAKARKNTIPFLKTSIWENLKLLSQGCNSTDIDSLMEEMIIDTSKKIQQLDQQINRTLNMVLKKLPKDKINLLKSIPGISANSAVKLLVFIGDVERFRDAHQLVGFFGLYPVIKESGDGKKDPHICKKGNATVRKTLYMNVMTCVRDDEHMKSIYNAALEKGKCEMSAMGMIMQKMLRVIYGILKNNQCYDSDIDKANREKYQAKKSSYTQKDEYCYENDNLAKIAPISYRNTKYRKEQTKAYKQNQSSYRSPAAPSVNCSEK